MDAQRGQALIETALCLPLALLILFAILYFGRFGVLEERAQSAVRYGATVSYETPARYRAADIYATLAANAAPSGVCPSGVADDGVSVLVGGQSGAPAQGYFKPDSATASTCSVTTAGFAGTATDAYHYFTVTRHAVGGNVAIPSYLTALLGANGAVSASLGFVHADPPGIIMYCTAHVGAAVAAALNAPYTASGSC
ncbi:MAG TPA: TadE/TadG family type IV pilus assembly protein [Candidatus Elarobacter sp.]|jgi:hypothetical protein